MKNRLLSALALLLMAVSSCSEDNDYNITVEMKEVTFSTKNLITEQSGGFQSKTSYQAYGQSTESEEEYVHQFPLAYKAYFVSKENKGQYTVGQVVKVIDVTPGDNTITIPKLEYDVYVTNYLAGAANWYTWADALEQLPQSSTTLYLYGKSIIDYSIEDSGSVTLINPYSAVMVKSNQWVTGNPMYYGDGNYYSLVEGSWYLRYIRNSTTNTMIPISIPGYSSTNYTLNQPIDPNRVYKYTVNGDVDETGELDNFTVVVGGFDSVEEEDINVFN